jgi:hypothetical protein
MIDNAAGYLPVWMLIAASFGLMIGWACGDETRRRMNAEQQLGDLRRQLQQATSEAPSLLRILKQQRGVLNDVHKRIVAVSKGLQKPAR